MRDRTAQLDQVLTGSFSRRLLVDVFRGTERVREGLEVSAWQFNAVLDAEVNVSGSLSIVYEAEDGVTLIPEGVDGDLSPFGSTLYLTVEISAGTFVEQVGLGWVEVVSVPSGSDSYADLKTGSRVVYSSVLEVEFASLDNRIREWGFRFPEQPASLVSVYEEVRRITAMPVTETVTDKAIPKSIVYEAQEGGRLAGVQTLFNVLDGRGVVDSYGSWVLVPNTWGSVAGALNLGEEGTVLSVPQSMDTEGVFNCVVGSFQEPTSGNPITAVAYVDGDDALGIYSDWGEHTRYITDDNVTTQAAANERVATELATVTQSQRYRVDVECIFNPVFELGDMVDVVGWVRPLTGRVVSYSLSQAATMTVTLEVKRVI